MLHLVQLAKILHEANRALCESHGDFSQQTWEQAEEWERTSKIDGAVWRLAHLDAPVGARHDAWMEAKLKLGWTRGEIKDANRKTHPCLVPFNELPDDQKAKDHLFVGIIRALEALVVRPEAKG